MSRGHIDTNVGRTWDSVTPLCGDRDMEQARHSAASRLPIAQTKPALEKAHGRVICPTLAAGAVFGGGSIDDQKQQGLAGQITQVPRTPNGGSPNIGRKRGQNPSLLRAAASPGHSAKMAQIFHHAQITLRNHSQPSGSTLESNSKKSRLPLLQRRAAERSMACDFEGDDVAQATAVTGCTSRTIAIALNDQTKQHTSFDEAKTPSELIANETYLEGQSRLCFPMSDIGHRSRFKGPTRANFGEKTKERSVSDELVAWKGNTRDRAVIDEPSPPTLGTTTRDFSIWDDGDDSELNHARRSTVLSTLRASKEGLGPGTDKSNVDKWLEDMLSVPSCKKWRVPAIPGPDSDLRGRFSAMGEEDQRPARIANQAYEAAQYLSDGGTSPPETDVGSEGSNKENQKPLNERVVSKYFRLQPKELLRPENSAAAPHKSGIPTSREKRLEERMAAAESPFRFSRNTTPRGYFLVTPRRRKQLSKGDVSVSLPENEEPVKLSPDVDPYRKANRPKRERRASYYDEDILVSPEKMGVLTESKMSRKLTRAMAFCVEAEDYEFTGIKARE